MTCVRVSVSNARDIVVDALSKWKFPEEEEKEAEMITVPSMSLENLLVSLASLERAKTTPTATTAATTAVTVAVPATMTPTKTTSSTSTAAAAAAAAGVVVPLEEKARRKSQPVVPSSQVTVQARSAAAPHGRSSNGIFPPSVLSLIFSSLGKRELQAATRVCREWSRAPLVASSATLPLGPSFGPHLTDKDCLAVGSRHLEAVTTVDLSSAHLVTDVGVGALLARTPQARHVVLSGTRRISAVGVELIGACLPSLQTLGLARCSWVTDEVVALLPRAAFAPSLTSLDLSECPKVTKAGLAALRGALPRLVELHVDGIPEVHDSDLASLLGGRAALEVVEASGCGPATLSVLSKCPALRRVDLSGSPRITQASLKGFLASARGVKELGLWECGGVGDGPLVVFARESAGCLESLDVDGCPDVSDTGIIAVAKASPRLRFVDLQGTKVTDASLRALAKCPELTQLFVQGCAVSDVGLAAVAEGPAGRSLRSIRLWGCSMVSESGVSWLVQSCPAIENIDLGQLPLPTAALLKTAVSLRGLRSLCLDGMTSLTPQALSCFASSCPLLEEVDLSGCINIDDASLADLLALARGLRVLHLSGCRAITARAFSGSLPDNSPLRYLSLASTAVTDPVAILVAAKRVTTVDLSGTKIGDDVVVSLAKRSLQDLTALTTVYVGGCPTTKTGLQRAVLANPALEIFS